MKIEKIIRNKLEFLEKKYGFQYEYWYDDGNHYVYKNDYGIFEYYEWKQFDEKKFTVKTDQEIKTIEMIQENPKLIGLFQHKYKGLKGFFSNNEEEYWDIICYIIRDEINRTGMLFGLKL